MLELEQLSFFGQKPYSTINTIQYLGSKRELLHWIVPFIEEQTQVDDVIIDLFAGTGSLGYALKHRNTIFSNDVQTYSYIINKALLQELNYSDIESIQSTYRTYYDHNFNWLYSRISSLIEKEDSYLKNDDLSLYEEYNEWCEKTPFRFSKFELYPQNEFYPLQKLIDEVDKLKADFNLMYTTYYSNAYFGIRQCMQIDSLRYAIEYMPTELKNIAFTALMSAMSFSVTSTTHFAQFLKVKNEKNYINVKSKRNRDIYLLFWDKFHYLLKELKNNNTSNNHKVFNKDFKEVLLDKSVKNSDISLIYADPPYFKEHYSRYYHLIESLVIYDYPELTFNPRINTVTVGRYPKDRIISDFGK